MPDLIIVAGPNGAGKTTFANEYLPLERGRFVYLNADEIAREPAFAGLRDRVRPIAAGRAMLNRIDATIARGGDLMFETTLATLSYAQKIPHWREAGYYVALFYLRLVSVEKSVERVRKRVAAGGHDIPEPTIRQRFEKSRRYLHEHYQRVVDEWYIWDSLENRFELTDACWQKP